MKKSDIIAPSTVSSFATNAPLVSRFIDTAPLLPKCVYNRVYLLRSIIKYNLYIQNKRLYTHRR